MKKSTIKELKKLMLLKNKLKKVEKGLENICDTWSNIYKEAEKLEGDGILITDLDDISSYSIGESFDGHYENIERVLCDINDSINNIKDAGEDYGG
jgi:hypothetical protein